jgi:serine phosphatase RsbU (regulator of sigma subunit)/anti-sigma regulatory factor (Ser/Thr protein kinase)
VISEPSCLRVKAKCDLWSARAACERSRDFLAAEGLTREELDGWELVLAEATKNAVAYATDAGRQSPIELEIIAGADTIQTRVFDHTDGFDFPETPTLPPPESRGGRGLYLMRELTDSVFYLRGAQQNCLCLQRRRDKPPAASSATDLQQRLKETEHTLSLMTEELSSAYESLATIFRFSSESHRSTDVHDFARRWLQEILDITDSDLFVLRLADDSGDWLSATVASSSASHAQRLSLRDRQQVSVELQAANVLQEVWFDTARPLAPEDPLWSLGRVLTGLVYPMIANDRLLGTLTLARNLREDPFTAGERNVIQTFADFLGVQIQNAHYLEENVQARLLGREMDLAIKVQRSLLPTRLPVSDKTSISAFCRNAKEVGGDFYDVIEFGEEGWLLVVADVMGKGLRAAMVATMLRTLVRSRQELAMTPGPFLTWLNTNLTEELGRLAMFVTAQLVYVDLSKAELRIAGAGHPPLLLSGRANEVEEIASSGPPLGLIRNRDYSHHTHSLKPGEWTLTYTDGLIELPTPEGELLGIGPLKTWLRECAERGESAEEGKDQLLRYLRHHTPEGKVFDDQAFILLTHA